MTAIGSDIPARSGPCATVSVYSSQNIRTGISSRPMIQARGVIGAFLGFCVASAVCGDVSGGSA